MLIQFEFCHELRTFVNKKKRKKLLREPHSSPYIHHQNQHGHASAQKKGNSSVLSDRTSYTMFKLKVLVTVHRDKVVNGTVSQDGRIIF